MSGSLRNRHLLAGAALALALWVSAGVAGAGPALQPHPPGATAVPTADLAIRRTRTEGNGRPAVTVTRVPTTDSLRANIPTLVNLPGNLTFPSYAGSNSPAHWDGANLYLFNSLEEGGIPVRNSFSGTPLSLRASRSVTFLNDDDIPGVRWLEATYKDDDGTLYGWYHEEESGLCPPTPSGWPINVPHIGAAVSHDNGITWLDYGMVLAADRRTSDCEGGIMSVSFGGGVGDFSVILDQPNEYFYFLFSSYAGQLAKQGVAIGRMAYSDRQAPVGKV